MFRKLLAVALCTVFSLAFASDAKATYLTTKADVAAVDSMDVALTNIELFNSNGHAFTNQVDGTAFTPGGEIRSISAALITTAKNGTVSPVFDSNGDQFVAISVLRGTITFEAVSGVLTGTFTSGRLFITTISATDSNGDGTGFDSRNPDSWNFSGRIAEWVLLAPDGVVEGDGSAIAFPAATMNTSDVDPIAPGTQTTGRFLFGEDSANGQSPGDSFITTDGTFGLDEGLFADIDQTLEIRNLTSIVGDTPGTFDGTDLTVLNLIAKTAGFGDLGGVAGAGFASALGGALMHTFDPDFVTPTGDHRAFLSAETHIVATPEPGSMTLLAIGLGAFGFCGARRRRNKKSNNG